MKLLVTTSIFLMTFVISGAQPIPLPEHPNPIHKRDQWINLNGQWEFSFDSLGTGMDEGWQSGKVDYDHKIQVPFPWGSPLSGVGDEADIGWYSRTILVPQEWKSKRVFIIVGASDWETHIWLNGNLLGSHQGGYVPFEFEITDHIQFGEDMELVIRADDTYRQHMLYGKQGYGNARGIWQTVYLESRGLDYLEEIHCTPDIDKGEVEITAYLPDPVSEEKEVLLEIAGTGNSIQASILFQKGQRKARTRVSIPNTRLWSIEDPFLYDVKAVLGDDILHTYFGMRKISVVDLPGTDIPYIALNNQPIYLQMALDQSYHPEGYYTFPTDQFMIDEINRSKSIGLNGIRTHIKVEVPRKLYWADKLGLLVMEDLPNSWGEPEEEMQVESTYTLREMIKRDYNHPSIFSWVIINETWGMRTKTDKGMQYLPESQRWLVSMYHLAKSLDPTRLVEDNSICCGIGHTVTDINSWHVYLPGYAWDQYLSNLSDSTFVGSGYNYEEGYSQGGEPNFNSECGNVWGYDGSTGDVDWSYDYHRMINSFRKYPKIGGWLYTEHHDVINEWNGYWKFDRSEKFTGFEEIVPGMKLNDLHAPIYISTGQDICYNAEAGSVVNIPLYISSMDPQPYPEGLNLEYGIKFINEYGEESNLENIGRQHITYKPWIQQRLPDLQIKALQENGLSVIQLILKDMAGNILHRNFVHVVTADGAGNNKMVVFEIKPDNFKDAEWSKKQWTAIAGKKVNGAGKGYFEYQVSKPVDLHSSDIQEAYFIAELSAKELFVKDQEDYERNQDFMRGSVVAPSSNPNSYPMTDEITFPSEVNIYINGEMVHTQFLPDDPADYRGVLSWNAQLENRKLDEAGSYGYLVKVALSPEVISAILSESQVSVKLEVTGEGGLAIYGKESGRYPFNQSIIFKLKE